MPKLLDQTIMVVYEDITILKELQECNLIRSQEETQGLEYQIRSEGKIRNPIVLWPYEGKLILIDGFTRLGIIDRIKLEGPIPAVLMEFASMKEAKLWLVSDEHNRRILTNEQMAYAKGRLYEQFKDDRELFLIFLSLKGCEHLIPASDDNEEFLTSEVLGKIYGESGKTMRRCGKFYRGIESVRKLNSELAEAVLHQRVIFDDGKNQNVPRALIENFGEIQPQPKRIFDISDIMEAVAMAKGDKEKDARRVRILGMFKKFLKNPTIGLKQEILAELDKCFPLEQGSVESKLVEA